MRAAPTKGAHIKRVFSRNSDDTLAARTTTVDNVRHPINLTSPCGNRELELMKKRNSQSITKATPAFVCMAGVDWWYMSHAHSEIQLMSRVARSRRVLFVNSIGMRMPSPSTTTEPSRRIWNKIKSIGHLVQRPMPERPNFWVFSPLSLPFFRSSRGRAINSALVRFQLRVVLFALRMPTPVLIVTLPTAWEVIRHLPRRALRLP